MSLDRLQSVDWVDVSSWSQATHERNMRLAINAARRAALGDGTPVGAVVVDSSGRLVAHGSGLTRLLCDPTAHAETIAIRGAAVKARRTCLSDLVLYTTFEPCAMCYGACFWADIGGVVYGADASSIPLSRLEGVGCDRFLVCGRNADEGKEACRFVLGGVLDGEAAELLSADGSSHGRLASAA